MRACRTCIQDAAWFIASGQPMACSLQVLCPGTVLTLMRMSPPVTVAPAGPNKLTARFANSRRSGLFQLPTSFAMWPNVAPPVASPRAMNSSAKPSNAEMHPSTIAGFSAAARPEFPFFRALSYVKVVELQRRGLPHFHAVIRLDDATALTAADLAALIHQAAASVRLEVPGLGGELVMLRFGSQTDVQPLRLRAGEDDDRRVASYLAKYVTKSVAEFGLSPRRISPRAVAALNVRPHVREILWTVLVLANSPGPPEMARWLHTLGYRGHITTKTRAYSTTMGALRAHRAEWRASKAEPVDDGQPTPAVRWRFIQVGHRNEGERLLATTADAAARTSRLAAREELACRPDDGLGL